MGARHEVGVAKGVRKTSLPTLRANFEGECSEVEYILQWQK